MFPAIRISKRSTGTLLAMTLTSLALLLVPAVSVGQEIPASPLRDVKRIQILPTVIDKPGKVKNPDAAATVEDSLRKAVLGNDIQVASTAPVRARIVLDEFTGGSSATRFLVGFGAGRSTVDCQLQLLDATDNEIASARLRVRGNMNWNPYEGNSTQTKQALNKFEQALSDQIDRWMGPHVYKVH